MHNHTTNNALLSFGAFLEPKTLSQFQTRLGFTVSASLDAFRFIKGHPSVQLHPEIDRQWSARFGALVIRRQMGPLPLNDDALRIGPQAHSRMACMATPFVHYFKARMTQSLILLACFPKWIFKDPFFFNFLVKYQTVAVRTISQIFTKLVKDLLEMIVYQSAGLEFLNSSRQYKLILASPCSVLSLWKWQRTSRTDGNMLASRIEAFTIYCSDGAHILKAFTWEKLLDSIIPLDRSLFQPTLARTKCNLVIFSRAIMRELASELLELFIPHRKSPKL